MAADDLAPRARAARRTVPEIPAVERRLQFARADVSNTRRCSACTNGLTASSATSTSDRARDRGGPLPSAARPDRVERSAQQ